MQLIEKPVDYGLMYDEIFRRIRFETLETGITCRLPVRDGGEPVLAWSREDAGWRLMGKLSTPCLLEDRHFRAGEIRVTPPQVAVQDVDVGGVRLRLVPEIADCPPPGGGG